MLFTLERFLTVRILEPCLDFFFALLSTFTTILKTLSLLFFLTFTSILFYILLYRNLVPSNLSVSRDLYFDPSTSRASISLLSSHDQWISSSSSSSSSTNQPHFTSTYSYDFWITLTLYDAYPPIENVFSCILTLSDMDNYVLARSVRPVHLSHRSFLVMYYEDISDFIKYLLWFHDGRNVERHTIKMMDSYNVGTSSSSSSLDRLNVTLHPHINLVQSATISWEIRLSGLSYILYEWRLISFITVLCCCIGIQGLLFVVVLGVLSAIVREREREMDDDDDDLMLEDVEEEKEENKVDEIWSNISTPPSSSSSGVGVERKKVVVGSSLSLLSEGSGGGGSLLRRRHVASRIITNDDDDGELMGF
jgi:hypothetical protein